MPSIVLHGLCCFAMLLTASLGKPLGNSIDKGAYFFESSAKGWLIVGRDTVGVNTSRYGISNMAVPGSTDIGAHGCNLSIIQADDTHNRIAIKFGKIDRRQIDRV